MMLWDNHLFSAMPDFKDYYLSRKGRFLFMGSNIIKGSPKDIILESVYPKVSYEVFDAIWKADNIESVSDLKPILSEDDYELVLNCVKMRFMAKALKNYTEFLIVIGSGSDILSEGLTFDW